MLRAFILVSLLFLTVFFQSVQAQNSGSQEDATGANVISEFGLSSGKILPNQIPGMTEIIGLGGFRFGYRVAPRVFIEGGASTGNGEGVRYKNGFLSLRADIPVETIVGTVFAGGDVIHYEGVGREVKTFGGGHVGGGVLALLGGTVWFRSNMKFVVNPGTSMYIDFGLTFRFP